MIQDSMRYWYLHKIRSIQKDFRAAHWLQNNNKWSKFQCLYFTRYARTQTAQIGNFGKVALYFTVGKALSLVNVKVYLWLETVKRLRFGKTVIGGGLLSERKAHMHLVHVNVLALSRLSILAFISKGLLQQMASSRPSSKRDLGQWCFTLTKHPPSSIITFVVRRGVFIEKKSAL